MLWKTRTALFLVLWATASLCAQFASADHDSQIQPDSPQDSAGQWSYGADIIFVLDESESIGSSVNFQLLKSYLRYLVGRFDYDDGNTRVGLVTYSTNVGTYVSLMHSTLGSLRSAISALRYNGGKTNTAAALAYVRKVMLTQGSGYRNYLPNVVVLIVAGPSYDLAATQAEAAKLKGIYGTKVIVIGIGSKVRMDELRSIASSAPDNSYIIRTPDYASLVDAGKLLRDAITTGLAVAADDSDGCTEYSLEALKSRFKLLMERTTVTQKLEVYKAVLADIAKYNGKLALQLKVIYLREAHYSETEAAQLFYKSWIVVVKLYTALHQLVYQIQYNAATRSDYARAFYGNAPLILKSLLRVLGQTYLKGEKLSWRPCFEAIALTVQNDARRVKISAICHVDKQSGLPQFPITGNIIFTQPLMGGVTAIDVSLCGFSDTNKHGWHVHAIGSTDNQCLAAGPHFNPNNFTHGAPDDVKRHVGDLGNFQPDKTGRIILKLTDNVVSLQGTNNILGRAVVIHQNEDDMGRGGDPGSLATGNAGARIACCVIDPCLYANYY